MAIPLSTVLSPGSALPQAPYVTPAEDPRPWMFDAPVGRPPTDVRAPSADDWFAQNAFVPPSGNTGVSGMMQGPAPGLMQNPQGYFNALIAGKPGTPETLVGLEPQLNQAGIEVMRNAAGVAGKIRLPNGQIIDVIRAAGAGGGPDNWQWLTGDGGGGGGIGAGLENTPGFKFRLGEGLKALERSAAARGTLLTGGTLKGLQRYAQDYASNEYGQRVNQLQSLASLGVNAAGAAGGAASAYGENAGNLLTGAGNALAAGGIGAANAQAAGQINAANAWTGGINNATNQALQMYYLSRMFPGGGATPPMVYGGGGPQMIPPAIIPTMTTPIPPIPR
jgi:hypothetical protein